MPRGKRGSGIVRKALRQDCKAYAPVVAQSKRRYDDVVVVISGRLVDDGPLLTLVDRDTNKATVRENKRAVYADAHHDRWVFDAENPLSMPVECHELHRAIVKVEEKL
jgi:hypothetical protein